MNAAELPANLSRAGRSLDALPSKTCLSPAADDGLERVAEELEKLDRALPARIDANPEEVERGLAKLVLTLIELVRQLLEKQAIRRIEGGRLTDEEIERLGLTFLRLAQRMKELQQAFNLADEDLNLNLGPLGDLM
jgi:hypothetical protein